MSSPDRSLLADWLRAIPQSRHDPVPLEDLPGGMIIGRGLAALLETWGAVEVGPEGMRAVSQSAFYFLHSLAAWAETSGNVILDWSGIQGVDTGRGMRHGTSLVHVLESERLKRDPDAEAIRSTPVAQILIVNPGTPPTFLTQWDERAGFFQVIGGRQKRDRDWIEPIIETAIREVEEELHGQLSYEAKDFQLETLGAFEGETRLSPSFGALTTYHFTFFLAFALPSITLSEADRWLPRQALISGKTQDGLSVRGNHLIQLEAAMALRIDELPSSFEKGAEAIS